MLVSARLYKCEGTDRTFEIGEGDCAACAYARKFVDPVANAISFVEHEGELFRVSQVWPGVVLSITECEMVTPAEADAELERERLSKS
jgi:hypothetical protein